ncbi:hypothetical protein CRYUN_Cryun19dG0162300 [Craigia yunnanensis]
MKAETTMVRLKALFASLLLLLLLFLLIFASLTTIHPVAATGVGAVARDNHDEKSHQMQQRKQRVNHGSFRGPRKHLLNPAVQHPFQLPKLPI